MQVIRGLFFDLDGTLFDTAAADYEAYRRAIKEAGYDFTPKMHEQVFGMYSGIYLPQLFPKLDEAAVKRIQARKAELYTEVMGQVKPNRQLLDFLITVRPHHKTVLVTTMKRLNAMALLEAHGIVDLFDHLVFGEDVTNRKPHPEAYLKALELTGLQAADVVAFEDSESGIEAAKAANVSVIVIKITKENS